MILDDILKYRNEQLEHERSVCSLSEMKKRAEKKLSERTPLSLAKALKKDTLSCICEVKKASPSKGLIRPDFRPVDIAREYEAAGADAISCLTEEHYFQGSTAYLSDIRRVVNIPILRKDFIFDEYQVFEAAAAGADAVLLIAAMLEFKRFAALYRLACDLGLSVLAEVHNEEELKKISCAEPQILGVNNRDLKTFEVDLGTVKRLRPLAKYCDVFVSESGIRDNGDMRMVRSLGADAVLIGETLMRSESIADTLHGLRKDV